jgi:hypothetical protein
MNGKMPVRQHSVHPVNYGFVAVAFGKVDEIVRLVGQINAFDQRIAGGAACDITRASGVIDDQRYLHRLFVEQVFSTRPVIARIVIMIRGQHNYRVCRFQMVQKAPQLIIALFDQSHVGRDYLFTHLVALERLRDIVAHIRAKGGVGVFLFDSITMRIRYVIGAIHIMVGGRDDVGPTRLDQADMRAPRAFGLLHQLNGLPRQR